MKALAVACGLALLAGCASTDRKGGYYKDDGPQAKPPSNLDSIADATPRVEPLHKWANRPYSALGKSYTPLTSVQTFKQRGMASWYGKKFHGQKTSSGEIYDMYKMTAAHPTLPIPSYVRVTRVSGGKRAWWCASTTAGRSTPAASSTYPMLPPTCSATSRPAPPR
jgi:rare lipoprotein A